MPFPFAAPVPNPLDRYVQPVMFIGEEGASRLGVNLDKDAILAYQNQYGAAKANERFGAFYGADGKLRYEISDADAKFHDAGPSGPLSAYLDHPQLYQAYPELKNLPVTQTGFNHSEYNPESQSIQFGHDPNYYNLFNPSDQRKRALLHETQHVVQDLSDFAPGTNLTGARLHLLLTDPKAVNKDKQGEIGAYQNTYAAYHRSLGESEAYDTEDRQNLTTQERRETPPVLSRDGTLWDPRIDNPDAYAAIKLGRKARNK